MATEPVIKSCLEICRTGSPGERFRAAEQLVSFGESAIPEILNTLKTPGPLYLAETCVWALGKIGKTTPDVIDALQALCNSNSATLSMKANHSLTSLKCSND